MPETSLEVDVFGVFSFERRTEETSLLHLLRETGSREPDLSRCCVQLLSGATMCHFDPLVNETCVERALDSEVASIQLEACAVECAQDRVDSLRVGTNVTCYSFLLVTINATAIRLTSAFAS